VLLLVITGLNVFKPAGLTPYGWRKQREERALRASFPSSQTASEPARPRVLDARPVSPLRAFGTRAASFTFHFAEMWFAMLLGMAVFMIAAVTLAAQGNPHPVRADLNRISGRDEPVHGRPMAAWMRFQGCDWRACGDMSIAMLLSTGAVVAFGAFGLWRRRTVGLEQPAHAYAPRDARRHAVPVNI
jgi:hypothetical protein